MLELKKIVKEYKTGDSWLQALKGVSINFRKSELVAILGASGCGKTTLLNIIGGLDHYTSGDLIINGRSTKEYNDHDWDTYRNHSIGFIFQSYNLIPHQTVLANVELALTLSGVSKGERRQKAINALEKVGLKDQINKKPNQLSGGQMQRVAIARALVNNPEILLADEPTGALDSTTSIQIMDILKEIAKDKLVIMVTHNPDLANMYATRIVKLVDGKIIDDSNPYSDKELKENLKLETTKAQKKTKSMSFFTALALSFNNLMTKKGRTILTSFAGSIGIIGIALILSVSSGVNNYIDTVEQSTMASYPITITETSFDLTSAMNSYNQDHKNVEIHEGYITSNDMMLTMIDSMYSMTTTNNLKKFKEFIEDPSCDIKKYTTDIKYQYQTKLNTYYEYTDNYGKKSHKKTYSNYTEIYEEITQMDMGSYSNYTSSSNSAFSEIIGNEEFLKSQYSLVYGTFPKNKNQVLIVVDENNQISDMVLYALGLKNIDDAIEYQKKLEDYNKDPINNPKPTLPESTAYSYETLCNYKFKLLLDSDYYVINDKGLIEDQTSYKTNLNDRLINLLDNTENVLEICGIVKPSESATMGNVTGGILYTSELMPYLINQINNSDVVKLQQDNPNRNMLLGTEFKEKYTASDTDELTAAFMNLMNNPSLLAKIKASDLAELQKDPTNIELLVSFANKYLISSKETILEQLGYVDFSKPSGISLYPIDFNSKDKIVSIIEDYNKDVSKEDKITYTDMVGLLLSSITIIVNAISYVLVAFVSISLIVSSIMIGIITYISVLERTKEIGILRAIGASKKDVSRVFNAESVTIGFAAGMFGIIISLLLIIPINIVLHKLTSISYLSASLPVLGAVILVLISVFLTFIAGLIPSGIAAKKDPVIALRTE